MRALFLNKWLTQTRQILLRSDLVNREDCLVILVINTPPSYASIVNTQHNASFTETASGLWQIYTFVLLTNSVSVFYICIFTLTLYHSLPYFTWTCRATWQFPNAKSFISQNSVETLKFFLFFVLGWPYGVLCNHNKTYRGIFEACLVYLNPLIFRPNIKNSSAISTRFV